MSKKKNAAVFVPSKLNRHVMAASHSAVHNDHERST